MTECLTQAFDEKLAAGFTTLEQYASWLDVNPKKLQRLLSYEDTSFSEQIDGFRSKRLKKLLMMTGDPLNIIAYKLGYSSTESLNAASKRWYNASPRKLRHQLLALPENEKTAPFIGS